MSAAPRTGGAFSWTLRTSQGGSGVKSHVTGKASEPRLPTDWLSKAQTVNRAASNLSSTPHGLKEAGPPGGGHQYPAIPFSPLQKGQQLGPPPFPCKGPCEGGTGSLCPRGTHALCQRVFHLTNTFRTHQSEYGLSQPTCQDSRLSDGQASWEGPCSLPSSPQRPQTGQEVFIAKFCGDDLATSQSY